MNSDDFLSDYLSYIGISEAPAVFHRWSALAILGAWLGRQYQFPFGHSDINPNMYVMLMGDAGSRKSTAINLAASLIKAAGYETIAADKSSKEKFLLDLAGEPDFGEADATDILDSNLFGDTNSSSTAEMLIAADEFNIFVGNGNIEFLALLGQLWQYDGPFKNKVKNSKSAIINNPTISILGGNTPTSFSLAFPPEAIGQGIFSRLLLIHAEKTGRKITFPARIDANAKQEIVSKLHAIRTNVMGEAQLTKEAEVFMDKIYQTYGGINDVRFESYNNRRFTHLIKLCLLVSASTLSTQITESHVLYANTILTHAEHSMSKALGEFGKARHSDVSHKLMSILDSADMPIVSFKELWKHLHSDLDSPDDLKDLIGNLVMADKIMGVKGGYISKYKAVSSENDLVDFTLLTEEERKNIS